MEALQDGLGARIGLLPLDAPVFELLERDGDAGDGAAHEGARPHHPEIPVEIADFGLARRRPMIVAIEHLLASSPARYRAERRQHNAFGAPAKPFGCPLQ